MLRIVCLMAAGFALALTACDPSLQEKVAAEAAEREARRDYVGQAMVYERAAESVAGRRDGVAAAWYRDAAQAWRRARRRQQAAEALRKADAAEERERKIRELTLFDWSF